MLGRGGLQGLQCGMSLDNTWNHPRKCNQRSLCRRNINDKFIRFNQSGLTMFSVNRTLSTSTRCKCRWLTLARAPGLLKPMRKRRLFNLASSDKDKSKAVASSTCGVLVARSGTSRQWLGVSGLLLTRKLIRWSSRNCSSKRRSSALILLKLKASGEKWGRREGICCGCRRRVVLCSFSWKGWH